MTPSEPALTQYPNVRVERDDHVATVTLDRPEAKNACTGDMWVAIGAAFREISYSGARAVVLTGAGGDFCAGADLGGGGGGGGRTGGDLPRRDACAQRRRARGRTSCPIPVIAKVDGVCVGAGLGLALAADITWCSDRARFSVIYAKRGLSLDFGTSWLLRQRIGVHKAKELAFTAEMMSASRALEVGLVNAVVPAAELDDAVAQLVDDDRGRPADRVVDDQAPCSTTRGRRRSREALEAEALAQNVNIHTEDMGEALTAYMERRPPTSRAAETVPGTALSQPAHRPWRRSHACVPRNA